MVQLSYILSVQHIASYIRVLIQRSKQDPSPFWSKRVAFIDSWFLESWVHDYKEFEVKPEMVKFKGSGYEGVSKRFDPHRHSDKVAVVYRCRSLVRSG